jgi:type II secretory pathway component PulF
MVRSGLPIVQAMQHLEVSGVGSTRRLAGRIGEVVRRGGRVSDVLAAEERRLGLLPAAFLRVGEEWGNLEEMSFALAELLERRSRLRRELARELRYPALVVFAAIFLGPLPLLVRGGLPAYLSALWRPLAVVTALPLGYGVIRQAAALRPLRRVLDSLLLRLPVVGRIAAADAQTRLCQVLAAGYKAGIPIQEVVSLAGRAAGNLAVEDAFHGAFDRHRLDVHGLSQAIASIPRIPPMAVQMCRVGETTGELDEMLQAVAGTMEQENAHRRQRAIRVLGVLALLAAAAWVASIVLDVWSGYVSQLQKLS